MSERILVIDDEPDVAETIVDVLRASGYDADMRTDSVAALALIAGGSYDLVVSDVVMPLLTGLQLLAQVKTQDNPPEVILVTGFSTREVAETALEHGAFAYVEKPFDLSDFMQRAKQALWKRHLAAVQKRRTSDQTRWAAGGLGSC